MSDLISRKDAVDYCNKLIDVERKQGTDEMNYGQERVLQTEVIIAYLEDLPSAEPEHKRGKWIDAMIEECPIIVCDQCNTFFPLKFGDYHNFCPNCGADMRSNEEEENEVDKD